MALIMLYFDNLNNLLMLIKMYFEWNELVLNAIS